MPIAATDRANSSRSTVYNRYLNPAVCESRCVVARSAVEYRYYFVLRQREREREMGMRLLVTMLLQATIYLLITCFLTNFITVIIKLFNITNDYIKLNYIT